MKCKIIVLVFLFFCFSFRYYSQDSLTYSSYYLYNDIRISESKKEWSFVKNKDYFKNCFFQDSTSYFRLVTINNEIIIEKKNKEQKLFLKYFSDTLYNQTDYINLGKSQVNYSYKGEAKIKINDIEFDCLKFSWELDANYNFKIIKSIFLLKEDLRVIQFESSYFSNKKHLFKKVYSLNFPSKMNNNFSCEIKKNIQYVLIHNLNSSKKFVKKASKDIIKRFGYLDFVYLIESLSNSNNNYSAKGKASNGLKSYVNKIPNASLKAENK